LLIAVSGFPQLGQVWFPMRMPKLWPQKRHSFPNPISLIL
jgi:hypothetical protein